MEKINLIGKYIDVLLDSNVHCLIIKGPAGIGKTKSVLDKLAEAGLKEDESFSYITGYITPLKLFDILSGCRVMEEPKLFVLDDLDAILKNRTSVAILKGALAEARGKRIVSYESTTKTVDCKPFEFTGKVILIVNSFAKNNVIESLLDRGIFYDMEIDPEEMIKYVEDNLTQLLGVGLSDEDRASIWVRVKRFADSPNFSLRALNRAVAFYKHDKENWYSMFSRSMKKSK